MFNRFLYFSSPFAVALGAYAGVTVANRKIVPPSTDENAGKVQTVVKSVNSDVHVKSANSDVQPIEILSIASDEIKRWDSNWDKRDPLSMINQKAYQEADEEKRAEIMAKVTPTATRNIFLIRHGQYELDSDKRELTTLGREQSDLLGKRLAEFEIGRKKKINKCLVSTVQRAKETAEIALKHLPYVEQIQKHSDLLREGAPCEPEPPFRSWRPPNYFFTDGPRIEAAFRKYIHRASPKQKEDSYEVIFCHANVIRYLVCRALQFPPEGWLRISLVNSSITWLQIRPSGGLSLLSLGDFGHLPPEKVTFT